MNSLTTVFLVDIFVVSGCISKETKFSCSLQVFLAECAGPLIIYLMFYFRLPFIYSPKYDFTNSKHWVVQWVSPCFSVQGSVAMLQQCITQSQASHRWAPQPHKCSWWNWGDGLQRASALITAKYVMCDVMCCCSLACMCHSLHYIKRILETMFVHRISHGTMPLRNIFKVSERHNFDFWISFLLIINMINTKQRL